MSTIIDTPDGIAFARLAALKGALSLQEKGMRLSRGRSATAIGKAEYGLTKNTASGQLPIVTQEVEDLHMVRECSPAMQEHLGYLFAAIGAELVAQAPHNEKVFIEGSIRSFQKAGKVTGAEADVLRAIGRIALFEKACHPHVRVLFRA